MRILALVYDKDGQESSRVWLNNASETVHQICCIKGCREALGWTYPYCARHLDDIFGVCVRPSEIHGMGLFATREFAKGEPIVPLGGEVITPALLQARYSATGDPDCTATYAITVGNGIVDALRLRHAWAFANHHDSRPNCDLSAEGIVARRGIRPGKELLVDYGPRFLFQGEVKYFLLP